MAKKTNRYELVGERISIFRRSGFWHANFQLGGRQQRRALGTRNKREARRKALEIEQGLAAGMPGQAEPLTVAEAVKRYMDYLHTEKRRPKTLTKYRYVLRRLETLCEQKRVKSVAGVDLMIMDAYRAHRVKAGRSPKTVYTETVIIRQLVNYCLSRKVIHEDPLRGLRIKKPKPTRQPCWTLAEVEAIVSMATEPAASCFILLAETGLRIGELVNMTWDDVDFEGNSIEVRRKENWQPKNGDERSVPMSSRARAVLDGLPREGPWVVTRPPPLGRQMSDRWLLAQVKRILNQLGLKGHLHTFRHSFISRALNNNTPEPIVRSWVGHVDREVIRQYTHVERSISQDAMRLLSTGRDKAPE